MTGGGGATTTAWCPRTPPKTPVPEYDRLTLVVDRATLGLWMLIARDGQGGTSTFVFTKLRENVGLADAKFAFTIPKGADVVAQD